METERVNSLRHPQTFEELVAASGERLLRTAVLLTGDRHHAEDLLQST